MNPKPVPATWPFVLALAASFVLCLAGPRSWQRQHAASVIESSRSSSHNSRAQSAPHFADGIHRSSVARSLVLAGGNLTLGVEDPPPKDSQKTDVLENTSHGLLAKVHQRDDADVTHPSEPLDLVASQSLASATPEAEVSAQADGDRREADADLAGKSDEPRSERPELTNTRSEAPRTLSLAPADVRRRLYRRSRRAPKVAASIPRTVWGEPTVLLHQLDRLASDCDTGLWATRVGDVVRELCRANDVRSPRTALALKQLRDLVDAGHPLLALPPGAPHAGELRRMRYAVQRRVELWELVPELTERRSEFGGRNQTVSLSSPKDAMEASDGVGRLLSDLERFEQSGLTDDGRDIVADVMRLAASDEKLAARTHRWLEWNYRNSNLRIVFSHELLNRLVPEQPAVEEPVHDRILGIPTRGWSTSTAQLSIRLIPDPRNIRFAIEAKGIVFARTASRRDPVTVYSNSDSAFLARKQLQLSASGLQAWPTEAEVTNKSRLRGIETDYDDVPLLGPLVEGIARAKHAETEPAVRRVARRKVAARVQEVVDEAIEPKLVQARQLYRERVVTPLEGLALEPAVIELLTSDARLTGRLRLAGQEQLAASTPRPMALSESLASVQLHQSLINNVCDRLDLDGRTFTLPELQARLVKAFKLPPESLSEEYPSDLRVTFTKRDALIARFDDGHVELTLGIAELHKRPKTWRDFQVRVFYRPQVKGLDVRFVRDGTVQLRGDHFGREPQIVLRGIFSKIFSHDRELVFLKATLLADRRLAGLSVTQCVVTDGWIGLSLGLSASKQAMRRVGPLQ